MAVAPVERFVAMIRERTGNVVPPARHGFLTEVLERRSRAAGADSPHAYLDALERGDPEEEWERLVPLVTIKESYFFRAPQQFAAIERKLLPLLLRSRAGERRLRVWSVACARGEEPGTLAILFAENELLRGWDWEIVGTDVDGEALETARRGLYGERAVSHVPPAQLERWFRPRGKLYELLPSLRRRIRYRRLNLARPPYDLVREARHRPFDLVLLRNVLIYFRRPLQRRVVAGVAEAMAGDGALFLGASETLWQIQERLVAYDLGNCFCYRHRAPEEPWRPLRRLPAEEEARPEEITPDTRTTAEVPWLGTGPRSVRIGGTAETADGAPARKPPGSSETATSRGGRGGRRADVGTEETVAASAPGTGATDGEEETAPQGEAGPAGETPAADAAEPPAGDDAALADALEAQEDEDARHLHAEPCGIQDRLLEVARMLAGDRVEEAGRELREVLEADPSEAAAHALDGFLHDLRGELEDAVSSYRAALYLDPALYQVRLLLADAMRREGWEERARHEYREVLASLSAGRERMLVPFDVLPVPDRRGAERRCRRALGSH